MRNAMHIGFCALGVGRCTLVFPWTPVAWFLCAVHRILAPRSTLFGQYPGDYHKNVPFEHYAAIPLWFRDITPDNPEEDSECNLPELYENGPLFLVYWEGLFYALAAEIRYLYRGLRLRFGVQGFERGDKFLIDCGPRLRYPLGCQVTFEDCGVHRR